MPSPVKFTLIVAATQDHGIGRNNNLPWRLPPDQAYFKRVTCRIPRDATSADDLLGATKQNAVIMGRLTWESVPVKMRPLTGRFNIVVSRNPDYLKDTTFPPGSVRMASSLSSALALVDPLLHPRIYIIGGAQIYRDALALSECEHVLLTRIHTRVECDTFFPDVGADPRFRRASHHELVRFVEEDLPEGVQMHKGLEYEYMLFSRVEEVQL
ncbi:dihydrofolate reductase [Jimgerdemannia flammicorona]|nr:dihydrofolate reductase [Jimgerdemannia flammicorona]